MVFPSFPFCSEHANNDGCSSELTVEVRNIPVEVCGALLRLIIDIVLLDVPRHAVTKSVENKKNNEHSGNSVHSSNPSFLL